MHDAAFEWDESKAAKNYAAHGVSFEAAREVFKDPFAIEWLDAREHYGEDRFVIIGMAEGRLLYVAYTMRDEVIRIISARRAEPHERRRYHEENSRQV
ncbi:MAG: BrnT family toxin [Thermodesulfobacteriota bacterium]